MEFEDGRTGGEGLHLKGEQGALNHKSDLRELFQKEDLSR